MAMVLHIGVVSHVHDIFIRDIYIQLFLHTVTSTNNRYK